MKMSDIGEALRRGMKENHGGSSEQRVTMREDRPWKLWERKERVSEIERERESHSSEVECSNEEREKKMNKILFTNLQ